MRHLQDAAFIEEVADDLEADREAVAEPQGTLTAW